MLRVLLAASRPPRRNPTLRISTVRRSSARRCVASSLGCQSRTVRSTRIPKHAHLRGGGLSARDDVPHSAHARQRGVNALSCSFSTLEGESKVQAGAKRVTIGDVSMDVPGLEALQHPEFVPSGYLPKGKESGLGGVDPSQQLLGHLRWMMQKDKLQQDMYLLGPPGPMRRHLALQFCELTQRECEVLVLSRDTTESDLKQRREIVGGDGIMTDQAPVRAAIHGRVLVLDGMERVERNVLPTLNNLLENREMALDDGRFLMAPEAYDALLQQEGYSVEEMTARNLVRVHENFRVIALGLPVPPFAGKPLDPPLRSRFQARVIAPTEPDALFEQVSSLAPSVATRTLQTLVTFGESMKAIEGSLLGGSNAHAAGANAYPFPEYSLAFVASSLEATIAGSPEGMGSLQADALIGPLLARVYPFLAPSVRKGLPLPHAKAIDTLLVKLGIDVQLPASTRSDNPSQAVIDVQPQSSVPSDETVRSATSAFTDISLRLRDTLHSIQAPTGHLMPSMEKPFPTYVETPSFATALAEMMQDHAVGRHVCVIGDRGAGKSALAGAFAVRLGYQAEIFSLYADMSARELLQSRGTSTDGSTLWLDSPLLRAALDGNLCILDGVHRLPPEVLAVLQRLLVDGECELHDGRRILSATHSGHVSAEHGGDDKVLRIHPSFRVIGLGETPTKRTPWLQPSTLEQFSFVSLPRLQSAEISHLLGAKFPELPKELIDQLVAFRDALHAHPVAVSGAAGGNAAVTLTQRQLIRLCRHMLPKSGSSPPVNGGARLASAIRNMMLADFQPAAQREVIAQALVDVILPDLQTATDLRVIAPSEDGSLAADPNGAFAAVEQELACQAEIKAPPGISVQDGWLRIGSATAPVQADPARPELVPRPRFFDNPRHTRVLEGLLEDHVLPNERGLLLIGNQGVGKNKLADRLLQLLGREREYIQLHRDTTIQTLTLAPSLQDGVVVWADSPLVKAVEHGRVLVIDEADKAPLEVVVVLKSLLEDGEMRLGDGRRCLSPERAAREAAAGKVTGAQSSTGDVIIIHPEFRMWVLANRPGFPFHGNNFFKECGDIFSIHTVHNPDIPSELELLRSYAPDVSAPLAGKLAAVFQELRRLEQHGELAYPYSSRELVAIVRHMQAYPSDGVVGAMENVIAFDAYAPHVRRQLSDVCISHGIPLSAEPLASANASRVVEDVGHAEQLPPLTLSERWRATGIGMRSPGAARPSVSKREMSTFAYQNNNPNSCTMTMPVRMRSTTSNGLLCETVSQPLRFERWQPGSPVMGKFRPEDSRITRFSEEKKNWSLPRRGARQSAVALASLALGADSSGDDSGRNGFASTQSLHCLSVAPMGIHSYFSANSTNGSPSAQATDACDDDISSFVFDSLEGGTESHNEVGAADDVWRNATYQYIDIPLGRFLDEDDDEPSMLPVRVATQTKNSTASSSSRRRRIRPGETRDEVHEQLAILIPSMATLLCIDPSDSAQAWTTVRLPDLPATNCAPVSSKKDSRTKHSVGGWITQRLGIGNGKVQERKSQLRMQVVPEPLGETKQVPSKLLFSRERSDTVALLDLGSGAQQSQGGPILHEIVLPRNVAEAGGLRSTHFLSSALWLLEDMQGKAYYAHVHTPEDIADTSCTARHKGLDGTTMRLGPAAAHGMGGRTSKANPTENARKDISSLRGRVPVVSVWPLEREVAAHEPGSPKPASLNAVGGDGSARTPPYLRSDPRGHSSRLVHMQSLATHMQQVSSLPFDCSGEILNMQADTEQTVFASRRAQPLPDELRVDGAWRLPGNGGMLVAAFSPNSSSAEDDDDVDVQRERMTGIFEVLSLDSLTTRQLSVPPLVTMARTSSRAHDKTAGPVVAVDPIVDVAEMPVASAAPGVTDIVTLQRSGVVRQWQVDAEGISRDRAVWREMFGLPAEPTTQDEETTNAGQSVGKLKYDWGPDRSSIPRTGVSAPKHGKEDDQPHVGGNTWAGGTGGSDTAGLGGRGGPYRLDKGHPVHQISEEAKREVSDEVRQRAGEMARDALAQRLDAINMSIEQSDTYERIRGTVSREIEQLRAVLDAAKQREKERTWLKNQTSGELDDSKLVDGVTGERNIYKRRGEADAPFGTPPGQSNKKRLLQFVVDISGSMYRFNGQDGRLDRMLETSVMMMEALRGLGDKFDYSIVGHSGDGAEIQLVPRGKPPQNELEQLKVVETMVAHSQYCWSGDHTVEALAKAKQRLEEADDDIYAERYAFLVSDANLRRYGISPRELAQHMETSDTSYIDGGVSKADSIRSYAIFLASIGDEAERIKAALPRGRGFTCFDTAGLPGLFRSIFTAEFGDSF